MQCDNVLDLLKSLKNVKYKLNFVKHNETFCTSPHSFHWFNSTEILALSQVEIFNKVTFFSKIVFVYFKINIIVFKEIVKSILGVLLPNDLTCQMKIKNFFI